MGENINVDTMYEQRINCVQVMLDSIDSWDGSVEEAFTILEENKISMEKIRAINQKLNKVDHGLQDEGYLQALNRLAQSHKKLIARLTMEKDNLLKSMEQVMGRKNIVKSYISQPKETIFIDKDL